MHRLIDISRAATRVGRALHGFFDSSLSRDFRPVIRHCSLPPIKFYKGVAASYTTSLRLPALDPVSIAGEVRVEFLDQDVGKSVNPGVRVIEKAALLTFERLSSLEVERRTSKTYLK